jgi:dihydroflavonol-4-reductase
MSLTDNLVVVTGASGHLGNNVLRVLLEKGYKVRALVRSDTRALRGLNCEVVQGDVLDYKSLRKAFEGAEAVIHCAAQISISGGHKGEVFKINVLGTRNVIDAAKEVGVEKIVHVSSIHAFKDVGGTVNELSELVSHQGTSYDISKAEGLRIVQNEWTQGTDITAICPTALIGPYDFKPSYMGRFLISLAKGEVPALVRGGFDWVDVRDVAKGIVSALENSVRNRIYILSGFYLRIEELAKMWCEIAGRKAPGLIVPLEIATFGASLLEKFYPFFGIEPIFTREALNALRWQSKIDRRKAEEDLCYNPRFISETLKDTYNWFKENGYL